MGLIQFDRLTFERDALKQNKIHKTHTDARVIAHNKTVDGWGNDLFLDL